MNATRLLLLAVLLSTGCAIHSNLTVPAQQQFVLGGEQQRAFSVQYRNAGPEPVVLAELAPSGELRQRVVVEPGDQGEARFPPGSTALVINDRPRAARLEIDLRGDVGRVGMRYEAAAAASESE